MLDSKKYTLLLSIVVTVCLLNGSSCVPNQTESSIYSPSTPSHCFLPHFGQTKQLSVFNSTDHSIWLDLPMPKISHMCSFEPFFWKFHIMYSEMKGNVMRICSTRTCNVIKSSEKFVQIPNLKAYTQYQFQFSVTNSYMEKMKIGMEFSRPTWFRTKMRAPSMPRKLTTTILSPMEISLNWLPPLEINGPSIQYEVHYQTENIMDVHVRLFVKTKTTKSSLHRPLSYVLSGLKTAEEYLIWISACTMGTNIEVMCTEGKKLRIETLPDPELIELRSSTPESLIIAWEPYLSAVKYEMSYRPTDHDDLMAKIILDSTYDINSTNVLHDGNVLTILNLRPKTQYTFWLSFWFDSRLDSYDWPQENDRFIFETLSDRPNAPGKPTVFRLQDDMYQVTWKASEGNGATVVQYSLEGLPHRGLNKAESTNSNSLLTFEDSKSIHWIIFYSGNDTFSINKGLNEIRLFRVRARNVNGWSDYSEITEIDLIENDREYLIISATIGASIAIVISIFGYMLYGWFGIDLISVIAEEKNS